MSAPISGIYVAAITPRREGPEIDMAATFELIDFLSARGVAGISLLGSTGEFPHFGLDERARLVKLAVKRSRMPIIAGIAHSTLDGTLALTREAVDAGAAALLLMPPYFFRYSQDEIRKFYLCVAEEAGDTPILLYNIPQFSSEIEPATAIELITSGAAAGIKDSSGRWSTFTRLIEARRRSEFSLIVGHDVIFTPGRLAGADGMISGVACAAPELIVGLDRAIAEGNTGLAWRLDVRLQEFLRWLEAFPAPIAIREATAVRGIKTGPHATALSPRGQQRLVEFREWFKAWLPETIQESQHA